MKAALRRSTDGIRGYLIGAGVLVVLGILAILLEVQSPSSVQWTGIEVHGYTQAGITYYSYRGVPYSTDNKFADVSDTRKVPTTVWLHRSDPTDSTSAYIDNPRDRWLDFAFTVGWFVVAALVIAVGMQQRRRRSRYRIAHMGEFGHGLSDEVVRRIRAERDRRPTLGR